MSDGITVRERGETDGCPFCRDTLLEDDDVLRCGTCETRLHAACFHENGLACTVLGCGGRAVVAPTPSTPRPLPGRGARESKRQRKRRLREEQRAARARALAWTPRTTPAPEPTASDTPWYQGPIGLIGILGFLFIVPGVGASLDQPFAGGLFVVGLVGAIGWILAIAYLNGDRLR